MDYKYNDRHSRKFLKKKGWKSSHHDDRWKNFDTDVDMSGERERSNRHLPYNINFHRNKKKNKHYQEDATRWQKIVVINTQGLEKNFIIRSLNNLCDSIINPVNYKQDVSQAIFYVQGRSLANEIKSCNKRITRPDGKKLVIVTEQINSHPPIVLGAEEQQKLLEYMSSNYDVPTKTLNLVGVYCNPELKEKDLYFPLEEPLVMRHVVDIIKEHIPEMEGMDLSDNNLYNLQELSPLVTECPNLVSLKLSRNKIKKLHQLNPLEGLELTNLVLENTPLWASFRREQDTYVSELRKRFPKLMRLDGNELPPPIGFELQDEKLPPSQASYLYSDDLKAAVLSFLARYYTIFDGGDKQLLLDEYHDQALFSLSIPRSSAHKSSRNSIPQDVLVENRDLKTVTDATGRKKLLRQGKLQAVATLSTLPKTVHYADSFLIDVFFVAHNIMTFKVMGLFKIESDKKTAQILSFSRTLAVVPRVPPVESKSFLIVNEMLNISMPTITQARHIKRMLLASSVHSPLVQPIAAELPPEAKEQMSIEMAKQTGMNVIFSRKCLEESGWNFATASALFTQAKAEGRVPPEAFTPL